MAKETRREEFRATLTSTGTELLLEDNNQAYIKWLEDKCEWQTGTPTPSKIGVKCDLFMVVMRWSEIPEMFHFHYDEDEWQDFDGNRRHIRLWMRYPSIPPEEKTND